MMAGAASSDDQFHRFGGDSEREKERREERGSGGFYRRLGVGKGLGFLELGGNAMDGSGGLRVRPRLRLEEDDDTQAPRVSKKREGEAVPVWAREEMGHGLLSGLGRIGALGPSSLFFFCSNFFFFCFLYNFCKKGTKSIQTNF
jgi:hypothetical protein